MSSDYDYVTGEDGDDGEDAVKIPGRLKTQVLHKASFPKKKRRKYCYLFLLLIFFEF